MSITSVTALYIGTRKLTAFTINPSKSEPGIIKTAEIRDPKGFSAGLISNLEQAVVTLEKLFQDLPGGDPAAQPFYIVLGNSKLLFHRYSSSIYFQGGARVLTADDVHSVIEQTRTVATIPLSQMIIQAVPESFVVGDMTDVQNPIGLTAQRIAVDLNLFTMEFQALKNLQHVFEAMDLEVDGYYPKGLMVSEAVLTESEKQEGCILLDIADDVTFLSVWKKGKLVDLKASPWGAGWLSSRIAEALQVERSDAEKIKEQYGTLEPKPAAADELISLIDRSGKPGFKIKRGEFHEKFLSIAKEWVKFFTSETQMILQDSKVYHPHWILTGGGARLEGLIELMQNEFSIPARLGTTQKIEAPANYLIDPSYAAVLGFSKWFSQHHAHLNSWDEPRGFIEKTFTSAKSWFTQYF